MKHIPVILTLTILLVFVWGCTSLEPESEQPEPELSITYHTPNPPTGAVLDSHTVHLSWERSGDVPEELEEHVQLLHIYQELALEECDAVDGTAEFQDLENRQYRWRVIGLVGADTVGVSPDWEFEIDDGVTPPPAIRMIYPLDGDSLVGRSVRLQWEWTDTSRSKEEMRFRVHFGPSEQTLPRVAEDLDVEELVVSPRESQRWYGWYVVATDSTGVSWVSKTQIFYLTARFDTTYGWCYRIQKEFYPSCYFGDGCYWIRKLLPHSDNDLIFVYGTEYGSVHSGFTMSFTWFTLTIWDQTATTDTIDRSGTNGLMSVNDNELQYVDYQNHSILTGYDAYPTYQSLDSRIRVCRVNLTGSLIWSHLFEDTSQTVELVNFVGDTNEYDLSGFNRANFMTRTAGEGSLITGSVQPWGEETTHAIAYELDDSGNELWRKIYSSHERTSGFRIDPVVGGYRILVRERGETAAYWQWIVSSTGDLLSQQPLELDPDIDVDHTLKFNNGDFGVLQWEYGHNWIANRFDSDGNLLWSQDLGDWYNVQSAVAEDDEWVVLANSWLMSYSPEGQLLWSRNYYKPLLLCSAQGGGFYMVHYDPEPDNRYKDYVLSYLDELGRNSTYME